MQWRADARAAGFEHEAELLRAELSRRNHETAQLAAEVARARAGPADGDRRANGARGEATQDTGRERSVAALPFRVLRRGGRASR